MTAKTPSSTPGGHWVKKLLVVLVSLALTLGLAELAVRLADPPPHVLRHVNVAGYRLSDNPVRKYEYAPGRFDIGPGGFDDHSNFVINRQGFRDADFSRSKPAGAIRILALGDSVTAGNGVPDVSNTYPKLLEQSLNRARPARRCEVYNMGVGGYHTLQEIETLRAAGLPLKPDLVTAGFVINDFDEAVDGGVYENLMRQVGGSEQAVLGAALNRSSFRAWQLLLGRSRLAFFAYYRARAALASCRDTGFNYRRDVLKDRNPVESGLELLDRLQREHGFKVIIFVIPAFDWRDHQYRHGPIHAELQKIAGRYPAFKVVDFLPAFMAREPAGAPFTFDGLHPNEAGHRLIADAMLAPVREVLAQ